LFAESLWQLSQGHAKTIDDTGILILLLLFYSPGRGRREQIASELSDVCADESGRAIHIVA